MLHKQGGLRIRLRCKRKGESGQVTMNDVAMTYTGILSKDQKKFMRVRFSRNAEKDFAEYTIPGIVLEKSSGFSKEELTSLRVYLKANEADLKEKAKEITGLRGFFK